MSAPYFYDTINTVESHIVPGAVRTGNNLLSQYYRRYLAQRVFSLFEFSNIPENWDEEYLKFILICFGYCAVLRTDKFGVIPQQCGVSGYNVFYRPTRAIVCNPLFDRSYDLKIGEDCELIRLSPDWRGIPDLIGHYADLMALTVTSIVVNLYNSRLAYVFTGSNQAFAESFKRMYDKLANGDPAVFIDKQLMNDNGEPNWTSFQQDLKSTYIIDLLQGAERCLLSQFFQEIGIPNIPYEKGERLNMEESTRNDYATQCLPDLWKRTINATLKKVNKLFGLNVSVDYNKTLKEALESGSETYGRGNDELQARPV